MTMRITKTIPVTRSQLRDLNEDIEVASVQSAISSATADIASIRLDLDGFPDALKNLTTVEINQLENIGASTISSAQWGYLSSANQSLGTADNVQFNDITLNSTGLLRIGADSSIVGTWVADSLTAVSNVTSIDVDNNQYMIIGNTVFFNLSCRLTCSTTGSTITLGGLSQTNDGPKVGQSMLIYNVSDDNYTNALMTIDSSANSIVISSTWTSTKQYDLFASFCYESTN